MGARKAKDDDSALFWLLVIVFLLLAWPYFLGTYVAVQLGADNPSTARNVTGWVFEVLWLILLVSICIGVWVHARHEQAEVKRREQAERRRKAEFGEEGARLYEQAVASALRVTSSEAARTGWLGDPTDFDFRADLAAMADNLRKAESIRKVTADASSIRHFTESDKRMLNDAKRAVTRLDSSVRQRVKLIGECAEQAEGIDRRLRDDRERAEMEKRREELRSRLGPMLYGAEITPTESPSESADSVKARVAAFHELKALIDEHRLADTSG